MSHSVQQFNLDVKIKYMCQERYLVTPSTLIQFTAELPRSEQLDIHLETQMSFMILSRTKLVLTVVIG